MSAADRGLDPLARPLYWALLETLEADGLLPASAHEVALRAAQLSLLRMAGFDQREAAEALGVSLETADEDVARVRQVIDGGAMRAAASRRLGAVRVEPGERVPRREASPREPGTGEGPALELPGGARPEPAPGAPGPPEEVE